MQVAEVNGPMNESLQKLGRLHSRVDAESQRLAARHEERLQCGKGCAACCVDDLTVFTVEADRIRHHCGEVLRQKPHPVGACAFLDQQGACRIYPYRPYVCRTQGLPLRWLEQDEEDPSQWLEYRDICPLNEEGPPLETLAEESCWTLGPVEAELVACQKIHGNSTMTRVSLRELFATS